MIAVCYASASSGVATINACNYGTSGELACLRELEEVAQAGMLVPYDR